jgi:hypothetical protein
LIEAAKRNRYGHRDALMALLAFRHGLRAAEVKATPAGVRRVAGRASEYLGFEPGIEALRLSRFKNSP